MSHEQVLLVEFFLSVGASWFAYSYLYKRIRLDVFRERLFTVRDDLFDYMVQNNHSLDVPAYRLLRNSLNGMIRSAESGDFNLITMAIYLRMVSDDQVIARGSEVSRAIEGVEEPKLRAHLAEIHKHVGMTGFHQVWLEGPLSIVLAPVLVARLARGMNREQEVVEVGLELSRRDGECPAPIAA